MDEAKRNPSSVNPIQQYPSRKYPFQNQALSPSYPSLPLNFLTGQAQVRNSSAAKAANVPAKKKAIVAL
jgi:hypothetical protein